MRRVSDLFCSITFHRTFRFSWISYIWDVDSWANPRSLAIDCLDPLPDESFVSPYIREVWARGDHCLLQSSLSSIQCLQDDAVLHAHVQEA